MGMISKPHDKFFKETLSDLEITKDFMLNYLPKEILEIIDLDNLSAGKDSYIDKELEELFSDILFKTTINGKEGYIYFLFEHKSYLCSRTSLQLLKYMIKIWEQKINKENISKLPIIIPLVVYHGESKWNIDTSFAGIIEGIGNLPESIRKYIPCYEYILYDLSPYGDEEIKGNAKLRIFLEILKAIFNKNFDEFIKTLERSFEALEKLEHQEKGIDYFETFVRYIMNARNDINIKDVYEVAKKISLERSEEIMTIAEQLVKEGMQKGIKEGMQKGIKEGMQKGIKEGMQKGIVEGKRKTARNLLRLGFSIEQVAEAAELSTKEVMRLKREIEK
ncbi:MAG: Rpn family recombination-promoting nuclease/putative transposase [Firmicutes bacterium]|nr:Rpn family recombination-promoting nuclease/putative transposase [Bacillota bacterium]